MKVIVIDKVDDNKEYYICDTLENIQDILEIDEYYDELETIKILNGDFDIFYEDALEIRVSESRNIDNLLYDLENFFSSIG